MSNYFLNFLPFLPTRFCKMLIMCQLALLCNFHFFSATVNQPLSRHSRATLKKKKAVRTTHRLIANQDH